MINYKNLTIIGTSHIAKQSIDEITSEFTKLNPDIVALELDKPRLIALLSKKSQKQSSIPISAILKVGIKGYIFSLIGHWVEKKLGKIVGVEPGADMLTAFNLAKNNSKNAALIDQSIEITLKKLSKAITWREKFTFLGDIFRAVVLRKKEFETFDLTKVPSEKLMLSMMAKVKKKYPNVYRVLVTERNEIMAKKLTILMKRNPEKKIMATVGAGHEKEIICLIKKNMRTIEIV